jgi:uncharacterized membrane protein YkvA (DUF1232 family)
MKPIVQSFYNWYSNQISHPKYRWIIILGTLVYLISPFDISPDFLPILGWIDDGVVLTLLTTELSRLLIEQRNRRKGVTNSSFSQDGNEDTVDVEASNAKV